MPTPGQPPSLVAGAPDPARDLLGQWLAFGGDLLFGGMGPQSAPASPDVSDEDDEDEVPPATTAPSPGPMVPSPPSPPAKQDNTALIVGGVLAGGVLLTATAAAIGLAVWASR